MRSSKQIQNADSTPEQLLLLLDAQLQAQRSHRAPATRKRATILVVGVLLIVAATGAALLVLDQMVGDLRSRRGAEEGAPITADANF